MATVVYITSGTSYLIPVDYGFPNSIEGIGAGAGDGGAGSPTGSFSGGTYAKNINDTSTNGSTVAVAIGAGGTIGGDTKWRTSVLVAPGGGSLTSAIGTTINLGGVVNGLGSSDSPGGGGAGGPNGAGQVGGAGPDGGGGGGAGGGSSTAGVAGPGGNGGTAQDGTPGGVGDAFGGNGAPGSNGSGGGGALNTTSNGGAGGAGIEWDATHGAGGGGGGVGSGSSGGLGHAGNGGLYGGGGGKAYGDCCRSAANGLGAQGIIVVTYTALVFFGARKTNAFAIATFFPDPIIPFFGRQQPYDPKRLPPSLLDAPPPVVNNPPFMNAGRTARGQAIEVQATQPDPWTYTIVGRAASGPYMPSRLPPVITSVPPPPVNDPPFSSASRRAGAMIPIMQWQPDPWPNVFMGGKQPYQTGNLTLTNPAIIINYRLTVRNVIVRNRIPKGAAGFGNSYPPKRPT